MAKLHIDGRLYEVKEGKNLLEACLSLGFDLPYFCWHPALGSVGACRQCAVKQFKNEKDTHGKIVMSCMTSASEGAIITVSDPESKAFRASVIEWLMVNHPHDCPVCDEGGECHLQDMTLMTGHVYRRFRFKKRTFRNQDLGPFVNHEMNRCIACYRCVRFYRDYAGGRDLNVFSAHDHVYFGRQEEGVLESEFSGNLVEVCPTGVFTDKTFKRHYTRKWDLQTAPSVCVHCGVGCNTIPGERYGVLRRIRNRYHEEINGYFICDRGRYGYEFVNSDRRIRKLWMRKGRKAAIAPVSVSGALEHLGGILSAPSELQRTIGIGSPRASLEANFALRALVGPERFFLGGSEKENQLVAKALEILRSGAAASASVRDAENSDAALVLGEDITQTAPRLALALRQGTALFLAIPHETRLDEIADKTFHASPDEIARLGFAVAHALEERFPMVPGLSGETAILSRTIAQALSKAKRPVVLSGTGLRSRAVLEAAASVAWALHRKNPEVRISLTASEPNSFGLGLLGGHDLSVAFQSMEAGEIQTVIVLENDLFRRADFETVRSFLSKARRVIVLDHVATAMIPRADVIIPVASFAESTGTFVSNEGRAQRFYQVFAPKSDDSGVPIQESWRWLRDMMGAAGRREGRQWRDHGDIADAIAKSLPNFRQLQEVAPGADFRIQGERIPRQSRRFSGRTAMWANETIHEPKPPQDPDSPLAFSMEGYEGEPPAPLIPRYWAPGWNSDQALNYYQSQVGGAVRGGPSGKRIIEPAWGSVPEPFQEIPRAFTPQSDRWLAIPLHHIFGSEELSSLSPSVEELASPSYIALSSADAARLEINEGDLVDLELGKTGRITLVARLKEKLAPGLIGIPVGIRGLEGRDIDLPTWCELAKHRLAGAA